MNSRINIVNELKELNSTLPVDLKEPVFNVPAGYFENFATKLLAKLKQEDVSVSNELESLSPLLAGMSRKMPFSMPDNYFNEAIAGLPGMVADEQLPDFLLEVGKSMPYQVPVAYFDDLSGRVKARLSLKEPAKVISFAPRKLMRYAVAAAVAGIMAIGGIVYFSGKGSTSSPDSEEWVANNLKNVSTEELEEFINTADISTTLAKNEGDGKTEVRNMLNDVSDKELENFLEEVPTDNEDLMIN